MSLKDRGYLLESEGLSFSKKDAKAIAAAKIVAMIGEISGSIRHAIFKNLSNKHIQKDPHSAKLIDVDEFLKEINSKGIKYESSQSNSNEPKVPIQKPNIPEIAPKLQISNPIELNPNQEQKESKMRTEIEEKTSKTLVEEKSHSVKETRVQSREEALKFPLPSSELPVLKSSNMKEPILEKETKAGTEMDFSQLSVPTSEAFENINGFFMNVLAFATEKQMPLSEEVSQKNGKHKVSIDFGDISCSATASGTANVGLCYPGSS